MQLNASTCKEITLDSYADFLEETEIHSNVDLGDALITTGHHEHHGKVVLINQSSGRCAIVHD